MLSVLLAVKVPALYQHYLCTANRRPLCLKFSFPMHSATTATQLPDWPIKSHELLERKRFVPVIPELFNCRIFFFFASPCHIARLIGSTLGGVLVD